MATYTVIPQQRTTSTGVNSLQVQWGTVRAVPVAATADIVCTFGVGNCNQVAIVRSSSDFSFDTTAATLVNVVSATYYLNNATAPDTVALFR